MDIKKCIKALTEDIGFSKVRVAELLDTNVKQIDKVLSAREGSYIVHKVVLPKALVAGTCFEECV